jgi:tRNA dimethylallyltransferase
MQVYRGMDIGTAKPSAADRARVAHHLIDVADPGRAYSVAEFQDAGRAAIADIERRGRIAIVCGGSGLHFRALVDPLRFPPTDGAVRAELEEQTVETLRAELVAVDPESPAWIDMDNPRRVLRAVEIHRLTGQTPSQRGASQTAADVREYRSELDVVIVGVDPGDLLAERVARRLDAMLDAGWLEEAAALGGALGPTAVLAVGYRALQEVAAGRTSLTDARQTILSDTLALAKRQRTFFRRDPRITWLTWDDDPSRRLTAAIAAFEEARAWTS